jgi:hypothetical protein
MNKTGSRATLSMTFSPFATVKEGKVFLKQLRITRPAGTGGSHSFCTPE